jgi:uncharacterized FlaG/YvyC family protein
MIDALSAVPAPQTATQPPKAPTAPDNGPDLRDTELAVQMAQKAAAQDAQTNPHSAQELEDALNERLAKLLRSNVRVRVEIDKGTGDFVYKSIDKKTGEVDRQWPADSMLRMLAFFKELDGLLYDKKA